MSKRCGRAAWQSLVESRLVDSHRGETIDGLTKGFTTGTGPNYLAACSHFFDFYTFLRKKAWINAGNLLDLPRFRTKELFLDLKVLLALLVIPK